MRPPRHVLVLIVAAVVLVGAYVVGLVVVDRPERGYLPFWDGWLYFVGGLLPVVLLALRAKDDRARRLPWALIGAGVLATWIADLVFQYRDSQLTEWTFPAPSDVFYLLAYPLWAGGLLALIFRGHASRRRSRMLDGFIIGLTLGALAVMRWFGPIFDQSGSAADVALGITFAVLDLLLVVLAVASLAPQRYRPAPALLGFVVAAALFGLGDIVYLSRIADDAYSPGTWIDAWWALGLLMFGVTCWLPVDRPAWRWGAGRGEDEEVGEATLGLVPAATAMGALGIVIYGLVGGVPHAVPGLAAAMAVGAVALALIRVLWTLRELRIANEGFRQARTDDLTGLQNRRGFMEAVDALLEPGGGGVAVLMVDLDGFKDVNDSLGHLAGDRLLAEVSDRLAVVVREPAVLARLGGDEFGVAIEGDVDRAHDLGARLLAALEQPVDLDDLSLRVSASVGVAGGTCGGVTREDLIRMADVAMYEAKHKGGGIARYDVATDPHGPERLQFHDDLRRAVEDGQLCLHLQPVLEVASRRFVGVEALLRWDHPVRGQVSPAEILPVAERAGLMPRVTRSVFEMAARHLVRLRAAGLDVGLSINISADDLADEDLANHLRDSFRRAGAPLAGLTIEITETAITSDPARSAPMLQSLREQGVRVSIDDFGVGYSSLSQLLQLPVDELKLDRTFVAPLRRDRRAEAIVRSTVELGRTLGLVVVAEGVESEETMAVMAGHGVERAQGFHLGPPMPIDEVLAFACRVPERLHEAPGSGR